MMLLLLFFFHSFHFSKRASQKRKSLFFSPMRVDFSFWLFPVLLQANREQEVLVCRSEKEEISFFHFSTFIFHFPSFKELQQLSMRIRWIFFFSFVATIHCSFNERVSHTETEEHRSNNRGTMAERVNESEHSTCGYVPASKKEFKLQEFISSQEIKL